MYGFHQILLDVIQVIIGEEKRGAMGKFPINPTCEADIFSRRECRTVSIYLYLCVFVIIV